MLEFIRVIIVENLPSLALKELLMTISDSTICIMISSCMLTFGMMAYAQKNMGKELAANIIRLTGNRELIIMSRCFDYKRGILYIKKVGIPLY